MIVFKHHDFAASDRAAVYDYIDRLPDAAVKRHNGAWPEFEEVFDADWRRAHDDLHEDRDTQNRLEPWRSRSGWTDRMIKRLADSANRFRADFFSFA
jgi:hypothetical protein